MNKIKFSKEVRDQLINLRKTKNVSIEGNLLKLIDHTGDPELKEYVDESIKSQKALQRKRLDITKKVQSQNKELTQNKEELDRVNEELHQALSAAETSKEEALKDLDLLQKKTQFELVGTIVRVALIIIIGVGALTTALYIFAILADKDTQIIGNAWSNLFGILLTNSFSIIGTIMGVKYATQGKDKSEN